MDLKLDGKVAIVTGASRGLGLAGARALIAEGMNVVTAARSEGGLAELEREHPGRVLRHTYDAHDDDAAEQLVAAAIEAFGSVDVLVNNAGIAPANPFLKEDMAVWRDALEVNVLGPVALTQAVGRHMVERGGGGKVINIASLVGVRGKAWLSAYSASKGALVRFTEAVAVEWARYDIQVNAIAPGAFRTEAQQVVLDDAELHRKRVSRIPARRFAEPEEMDALLCYLASPVSSFVTGVTYAIDGGELARL